MQDCCSSIKHSALFYSSQAELFSFLIPYFKLGLENNELCLWVVPESVTIDEGRIALRAGIGDLDRYIEKGQFIAGDHKSFYLRNNVFTSFDTINSLEEKERSAIRNGFNGVCVSGDGSWALKSVWFNFLMYEQEVGNVISFHKMRGLCTYSLDGLGLDKISEISINHQSSFVNRIGEWVVLDPNDLKRKF